MNSPSWLSIAERGSVLGIRLLVLVANLLGRPVARGLLRAVALYYVLTHRQARRASRAYLERLGQPAGFGDVYRHVLRFAECALDRLFFVQGRIEHFELARHGSEHLTRLRAEKRGALLLGAHVGSFEVMRALGDATGCPIHVVVNSRNARMVRAVLAKVAPESNLRVIELAEADLVVGPADPAGNSAVLLPGLGVAPPPNTCGYSSSSRLDSGQKSSRISRQDQRVRPLDFVLKVRDLIDQGELVAIMGDRTAPGSRNVSVDFLDAPAQFPTGAYLLASILRCPVLLTMGLYRGGNRYDLYCEPFADEVSLPRRARAEAAASYAKQYAERLEHYCRLAPDNWFNFFDFWASA